MTIIRNLKTHFSARAMEWGMAGWAISFGLMILLYPQALISSASQEVMSGLFAVGSRFSDNPLAFTGVVFLTMGLIRASALYVNGAWRQTPLLRMITSGVSATLLMILINSLADTYPNTGVITYFWLFLADCLSAKRAASDWQFAHRFLNKRLPNKEVDKSIEKLHQRLEGF